MVISRKPWKLHRGRVGGKEFHGRPRLIVADDHQLVAEACANLLEPEFDVIAVVNDGRALLRVAEKQRPDVVVLDISMPGLNGLDAGEQLLHNNRATKLVYLTMSVGPETAAEAFRRGASGYVLKHCSAEELKVAVRCALRGESYLSPLIAKDTVEFLLKSVAGPEEQHLSSREREVLQLLAEGRNMKEIAYILHIKPGTVAFHKYRIMSRLGITSSAAIIGYAVKHHLIPEI